MLRVVYYLFLFCPLLWAGPQATLEYRFDKIPATLQASSHTHFSENGLTLQKSTLLQSKEAPNNLTGALKKSNALSLSAWITPAKLNQSGPARIVTISKDSVNRNITLGQDQID